MGKDKESVFDRFERPMFLTPYTIPANHSDESGLCCKDESLAVQSERDECDINKLVERYGVTGSLPVAAHLPTYQDFEGIFDFQSAMNAVISADKAFLSLPAKVRSRFGNDPQQLLIFLGDEANREEAISLGLVVKPEPAAPAAGAVPADGGAG